MEANLPTSPSSSSSSSSFSYPPPSSFDKPAFKFDLLNIKTPQLIGIIAGCIVFTITICVVIYLLVASGVVSGFLAEVRSGKPVDLSVLSSSGSISGDNGDNQTTKKNKNNTPPVIEDYPVLFDYILEARKAMSSKPAGLLHPLKGKFTIVRDINLSGTEGSGSNGGNSNNSNNSSNSSNSNNNSNSNNSMNNSMNNNNISSSCSSSNSDTNATPTTSTSFTTKDEDQLFEACNGSAIFGHPAYDVARMWAWINSSVWNSSVDVEADKICGSKTEFVAFLSKASAQEDGRILVIEDIELAKPIGFLFISNNSVKNLTIEIDNLYITPAFQSKGYAKEVVYLVLDWLFSLGYRRITAAIDSRHIVARQLFEKSFFVLECIQKKLRVVNERNSDVALYVILNSDWGPSVATKLKAKVGLDFKPKTVSAFSIHYDETKHYLNLDSSSSSSGSNNNSIGGDNYGGSNSSGDNSSSSTNKKNQ